ncbi:MAG: exodeoxyribonuclease III [Azoarcus sp.]|jgi:exodeoxyribonuclease-3|nr:exodeoxyribonuclease III [Azoarcus sp.]
MVRILSANLNGIRSALSKGFHDWLPEIAPDIICVQELKAQADDLTEATRKLNGMKSWFHHAEKKGYSGVGIYSHHLPDKVTVGLGIADIDAEGRYLQLDFPALSVVSLYLPSGSSSPERQAAKFSFMERFLPRLAELAEHARLAGREIVICGDWNIAHREIDLKNWKSNQKNSGFLPEERAWLSRIFDELGYVDVYRQLHPTAGEEGYTWWSNRGQAWAKNVGWRIDYQIASPGLAALARRAWVYKEQRFSDHAPLIVDYDIDP